jgi:hypothetical protein
VGQVGISPAAPTGDERLIISKDKSTQMPNYHHLFEVELGFELELESK